MATAEPPKPSRRKRRWGDGPDGGDARDAVPGGDAAAPPPPRRKSRFSSAPPSAAAAVAAAATTTAPPPPSDPKARAAALQASIQARLAALKARTGGGGAGGVAAPPPSAPATAAAPTTTTAATAATVPKPIHKRPPPADAATDDAKSKKRARVFELDLSSTTSTRLLEKQKREEALRSNAPPPAAPPKPKEKINPYLIDTLGVEDSTAVSSASSSVALPAFPGGKKASKGAKDAKKDASSAVEEKLLDSRLAPTQKSRLRSRPIRFVAPGTYVALGEKKREQAARAEESGFVSGRKEGNVVKSAGMMTGAIAGDDDGGGGAYGAGEAGKAVESRLPARADAPELELEKYVEKKKILTSVADVDAEKNDAAVLAALDAATASMPYAMEWWDAELLPSKLRKELAGEEGRAIASRAKKQAGALKKKAARDDDAGSSDGAAERFRKRKERRDKLAEKCYAHASPAHCKTHPLVQHPVPVLTPAQKAAKEEAAKKAPTLHLTRAERKRHRKLRRAERLRERQDLQAAGLVPPPEDRLTLSNYMKVLGDQAVLDPSRMEAKVTEQVQARKVKHEKMNAERKLTKEQKADKHRRKLQEDTSQSVKVALFYVKDVSHPYHRAKVDLNAQQNGITGGVLECEDGVNLVVAEGGEKAVKRYVRLMTVRMRWRGEDFHEAEDDAQSEEELMVGEEEEGGGDDGEGGTGQKEKRKRFDPNNVCDLLWTGMAPRRAFHSFMFQSAPGPTAARKILEAKGVAHYWDLVAGHAESKGSGGAGGVGGDGEGAVRFRLGDE
ncbi:hypothetical protein ACHAWF_007598, partial [Thalassiosira exigua]